MTADVGSASMDSLFTAANEARFDAIRDAQSLLVNPEDLAHLAALRDQYQQRFDSTGTWLSSTVASQARRCR